MNGAIEGHLKDQKAGDETLLTYIILHLFNIVKA